MRNAQSLPPTPDCSVICGLEAMPVIIGTLASLMMGIAARCAELQCEPMMVTTFASTNLLATLTDSEGLHLLSRTNTSTLRLSTPPDPLISSTARSMPQRSHSEATAAGPVMGVETPIAMFWARPGLATASAARKAAASAVLCMHALPCASELGFDFRTDPSSCTTGGKSLAYGLAACIPGRKAGGCARARCWRARSVRLPCRCLSKDRFIQGGNDGARGTPSPLPRLRLGSAHATLARSPVAGRARICRQSLQRW